MTRTDTFDYELPEELIAQHPPAHRELARMMVLNRQTQTISHHGIRDLSSFLDVGDVMVFNDTRVIPARLFGRKSTGGRVEVLLVEPLNDDEWLLMLKASRKPRPGESFELAEGAIIAELAGPAKDGLFRARLRCEGPIEDFLHRYGITPLPPYIRRTPEDAANALDRERYQTVFARTPGAVAAPTAGLHFTPELLDTLEQAGNHRAFVTLHVGPGTFRPVKAEAIEGHRMDEERYILPEHTAHLVNRARAEGHRCVAVGSTSVRTLESTAHKHGELKADTGRTDLFIHPPFKFRCTDAMLTNFHLPRSTLLMMVSALAGRDFILEAYRQAVAERYRFFSYGDCMLIL